MTPSVQVKILKPHCAQSHRHSAHTHNHSHMCSTTMEAGQTAPWLTCPMAAWGLQNKCEKSQYYSPRCASSKVNPYYDISTIKHDTVI